MVLTTDIVNNPTDESPLPLDRAINLLLEWVEYDGGLYYDKWRGDVRKCCGNLREHEHMKDCKVLRTQQFLGAING